MLIGFSLGPLERNIVCKVWALYGNEPLTVREVFKSIKDERRISYNTVLTIMMRLTEKGLLKRQKIGRAHGYIPIASQKQTVRLLVSRMFQNLVDQFGTEALTAFADEIQNLSSKEREIIKQKLKGK